MHADRHTSRRVYTMFWTFTVFCERVENDGLSINYFIPHFLQGQDFSIFIRGIRMFIRIYHYPFFFIRKSYGIDHVTVCVSCILWAASYNTVFNAYCE